MGRRLPPCDVPRCKGQLEPGMRDGRSTAWCRVCERRLLQVEALHEKVRGLEAAPQASAPRVPTDAELLALVKARVVHLNGAAAITNRSLNIIVEAAKHGAVPSVLLGRWRLFGRESLLAWNKGWQRKTCHAPVLAEYAAALPRDESKAVDVGALATRLKRSREAVQQWTARHLKHPQLRRRAALDQKGRAITLFWWQEEVPRG